MRRRRHTLKVSTFPFLAVLLCAMGSLILVLLAMDRKAKLAAEAKAREQAALLAEEAARVSADRKTQHERRKKDAQESWEKKRQALHRKLLTEEQILQLQMNKVREQLAEAAARLRAETDDTTTLRRRAAEEGQRLTLAERVVATTRTLAGKASARAADANSNLARMTSDLLLLEQTLKELAKARDRDRQTYSVIPYRGRRGESRRPLYIECAREGVIFHPERLPMDVALSSAGVRAEVQRRIALQQARVAAAGGSRDLNPYLLVLVRPDGIENYLRLLGALKGLSIDYGYEFIDPDWALDFPPDDEHPVTQPWMTATRPSTGGATAPPAPGPSRGMPLTGQHPAGESVAMLTPGGGGGGPGGGVGVGNGNGTMPRGVATGMAGSGRPAWGAMNGGKGGGSSGAGGASAIGAARVGGGGTGAGGGGSDGRPGAFAVKFGADDPNAVPGYGRGPGGPYASGTGAGGGSGSAGGGGGLGGPPDKPFVPWATDPPGTGRGTGGVPGGSGTGGGFAGSGAGGSSIVGPNGPGTSPGMGASGRSTSASGIGGSGGTALASAGGSGSGGVPGAGATGTGGGPNPAGGTGSSGGSSAAGGPPGSGPGGSAAGTGGGPVPAANAGASGGGPGRTGPPGSEPGTPGGRPAGAGGGGTSPAGAATPTPGGNPPGAPGSSGPGATGGTIIAASPSGPGSADGARQGTGDAGPGAVPGATTRQATGTPPRRGGGSSAGDPGQPGMPADGPRPADEESEPRPRRRPRPLKPGGGSGGPARPEDEELAEWAPPSAGDSKPRPRPVALRPGSNRIHDRTWIIFLECRTDAVILYPSRLRFPLASLKGGPDNPLAAAVNRMIRRRQASVAPGDPPYRPQLRFLVRPETLQAFFQAYSTLDALPVAKSRQNLQPEDDVNQILAGP